MLSEKKRRHSDAELVADFEATKIEQQFYTLFIKLYNEYYEHLYQENKDFNDDEFEEDEFLRLRAFKTARFLLETDFIPYIKMGHSEEWADLMRKNEDYEECFTMFYAYNELKDKNPLLAKEEILNYCRYINADEYFVRYFLSLFEDEDMHSNAIEVAHNYSKIYKNQIVKGESEIYAHHYAQLKAGDGLSESECIETARSYEQDECKEEAQKEENDTLLFDFEEAKSTFKNNSKINNENIWKNMFPDGDEDDAITDYLTKE